MRWRFPDSSDVREGQQRATVLAAIDAWWGAFRSQSANLKATFTHQSPFDIAAFMRDHLQSIDPNLMWEFGPGLQGTNHRLVITPESDRFLRPLVDVILARAPALDGWEFYPYRPAEDLAHALFVTQGRTGVDVSTFSVEVSRGEMNFVALTWTLPVGRKADDESRNAAFVATEALLGEAILDTWIGEIAFVEQPRPTLIDRMRGRAIPAPPEEHRLGSLKQRVEGAIQAVQQDLFPKPIAFLDDYGDGAVFKAKLTPATDYPAQGDVLAGSSRGMTPMWMAAHSRVSFSSRRYSRHGETFCYLKLERPQVAPGTESSYRGQIEDTLDEHLRPLGLGGVVGGSTGIRYSYVDLALIDLDRGLAEVRRVMQEAAIPKRAWILFFDSEWIDEWIGIYDDTSAPPQAAR